MNEHDTRKKTNPVVAFCASDTQLQIAAAWSELREAAKSDPKARAFVEAFGSTAPEHLLESDRQ